MSNDCRTHVLFIEHRECLMTAASLHFAQPNDAMTELDQSDCPVRRPKAVKADLAPRPVMEPLDRDIPSPQLHTLTVLVVDDDDGVRRTIARQLEQGGFRVLSAWNGVEALAVLEQPGELDLP